MYATVDTFPRPRDAGTGSPPPPRTGGPHAAAPVGAVVVDHLGDAERTVVTLWRQPGDPPAGDRVYRVLDGVRGSAAGRTPLFAQVTWLNGAGDAAVAQAAERAGRDRIHPAVRDVDGLVDVLVLRARDHRMVVVGLATGLETHTEVQDRIMRTRLLTGEDPALLPGPDRVALGRVVRADVPEEARP